MFFIKPLTKLSFFSDKVKGVFYKTTQKNTNTKQLQILNYFLYLHPENSKREEVKTLC